MTVQATGSPCGSGAIDADEELHRLILQSYEDIMIFRDVVERYQISRPTIVKDLMKRLLTNTARAFSVNKHYNDLKSRNVRVSKDTLYELLDELANAFTVFLVRKWAESHAKRERGIKKVYAPDTGMVSACTYRTSEDLGDLLETVVFLEMAKREQQTFYFRDTTGECDFVTEGDGRRQAVQVCYELTRENRDRELDGVVLAAERLGLQQGLILIHHQDDRMTRDGVSVNVRSAWKWALEQE